MPSRWFARQTTYAMVLAVAMATVSTSVRAQLATLDEGSFTFLRNGAKVGRESFTIRRNKSPDGDTYLANGTVDLDAQRLTPALRTDTSMSPIVYQLEVKTGDKSNMMLKVTAGRGRFSALVKTPRGESTHEYLAADRAILVDDDVFQHYYFLAQRALSGATSVPVIVPQRNAQTVYSIRDAGTESLQIGKATVQARHFSASGSDGVARDFWTDSQGRVLKVTVASPALTAQRDLPPR